MAWCWLHWPCPLVPIWLWKKNMPKCYICLFKIQAVVYQYIDIFQLWNMTWIGVHFPPDCPRALQMKMLNHYSREQRDEICLCWRWGNLQWLVKELYRGRNLKAHLSSASQKSSSSRYIVLHCVTIYCIAEHAVISYCTVISDKMTCRYFTNPNTVAGFWCGTGVQEEGHLD